ncbi:MAG: LacI family transcriptional regulator [Puniceicoccaceae bacterium 5H]|nr:MAG: LacI family transcriptional regulator [Puniceicoccaceae bacterium 5H]
MGISPFSESTPASESSPDSYPSLTVPTPTKSVTLAEIAKVVKMSKSGVSRALRNDPSIPAATCERVQKAADQLGFVSDQRISRVYSMIRLRGQSTFRSTIGFLNAYPSRAINKDQPQWYLTTLFENARERAAELGYKLDEISLADPRLSDKRIQSILETRGIKGLLVPPLPDNLHALPIDWKRYACVAITYTLFDPPLNRVTPNQYENMQLAIQGLAKRGYRRIGFMIWKDFGKRVNYHFHGAYYAYQHGLPPEDRVPILEGLNDDWDGLDEWYATYRPDAVIGCDPSFVELFHRRGLCAGEDPVGYVSLGGGYSAPRSRFHRKVSYICQNTEDVARSGIDILVAQIDRREMGVPDVASSVHICGKLLECGTTPGKGRAYA